MLEAIKYLKSKPFNLIENYIYLYHTDTFVLIPVYPEQINDNLPATFVSTNALARSAPIFSYQNSGPRTVQISLNLHRDMMYQVNKNVSNIIPADELTDDYVDTLVKQLQAIALPAYQVNGKMVNPPMIAIRFGDEIYVKGVVQGGISVNYELPLIEVNDEKKYAVVKISFTVHEIDPYDAITIMNTGSFRGLDSTLERRLYKG